MLLSSLFLSFIPSYNIRHISLLIIYFILLAQTTEESSEGQAGQTEAGEQTETEEQTQPQATENSDNNEEQTNTAGETETEGTKETTKKGSTSGVEKASRSNFAVLAMIIASLLAKHVF